MREIHGFFTTLELLHPYTKCVDMTVNDMDEV
jgi:hypothetical protein